MKTKILITVLVGLLIISVVSVGLVAAKSDNPGKGKKPAKHSRKGLWVGGYTRKGGVKVKGYYRTNRQYLWPRR